ncbi:hypothetical protein KSS87_012757, partial [Heliosperma pusillum]
LSKTLLYANPRIITLYLFLSRRSTPFSLTSLQIILGIISYHNNLNIFYYHGRDQFDGVLFYCTQLLCVPLILQRVSTLRMRVLL